MKSELLIRPSVPSDAVAISHVIVRALQETNAKDYSPEIIASVVANFSPERISRLLAERVVLVAISGIEILGTASLQGPTIRTVFVRPDAQGRGIGAALMKEIEQVARQHGLTRLTVPSSVTAEPFYQKLGFDPVRDEYHGEERTIIMEKTLEGATA
jgi:predicted N-acetyltransferase YhbS